LPNPVFAVFLEKVLLVLLTALKPSCSIARGVELGEGGEMFIPFYKKNISNYVYPDIASRLLHCGQYADSGFIFCGGFYAVVFHWLKF
jgi:hypothetical protein